MGSICSKFQVSIFLVWLVDEANTKKIIDKDTDIRANKEIPLRASCGIDFMKEINYKNQIKSSKNMNIKCLFVNF